MLAYTLLRPMSLGVQSQSESQGGTVQGGVLQRPASETTLVTGLGVLVG